MYGLLICPICQERLEREGNALRCSRGHSYDIAGSGYVNLLPPGRKSNASTGDHDDMIRARRAFLSRGYYDEYVRRVANLVKGSLSSACGTVIDAACGEGHHSLILAKELEASALIGIDASKKAADTASKAARRFFSHKDSCTFVAGNIFSMPVESSSADAVTVLFAPIPFDEVSRVLRPGGILCTASAGDDHLIELRRLIYDDVRVKEKKDASSPTLRLLKRDNVSYTVELDSEGLGELFAMTPFCRRCDQRARDKIASVKKMKMTVSVDCVIYRKEINDENFDLHTNV